LPFNAHISLVNGIGHSRCNLYRFRHLVVHVTISPEEA
jgi:hypothetical protein